MRVYQRLSGPLLPGTEASSSSELFGIGQDAPPAIPSAGPLIMTMLFMTVGAFMVAIVGQIAAGLGSAVVPLRIVEVRNRGR